MLFENVLTYLKNLAKRNITDITSVFIKNVCQILPFNNI